MKRRGFFTGIAGMITGTAVAAAAQEPPRTSVTLSNCTLANCDIYWESDGKRYKLIPTKTIVPMPPAKQINLSRPIFMLEEVK